MTLINFIAKSLFIREDQYGNLSDYGEPNSFHIYAPGPEWSERHFAWANMTDEDKAEYLAKAEIWISNLRENSPATYSYVLNNFKNNDNLELL
jgi:hypothetical protein